MSYEGREQILCKDGHYRVPPARYGGGKPLGKCPCGAKDAWINQVDDTNGYEDGVIDMTPFLIEPAKTHTCTCGHVHVVEEERYRVPTPEETRKAQTYGQPDNRGKAIRYFTWSRKPVLSPSKRPKGKR